MWEEAGLGDDGLSGCQAVQRPVVGQVEVRGEHRDALGARAEDRVARAELAGNHELLRAVGVEWGASRERVPDVEVYGDRAVHEVQHLQDLHVEQRCVQDDREVLHVALRTVQTGDDGCATSVQPNEDAHDLLQCVLGGGQRGVILWYRLVVHADRAQVRVVYEPTSRGTGDQHTGTPRRSVGAPVVTEGYKLVLTARRPQVCGRGRGGHGGSGEGRRGATVSPVPSARPLSMRAENARKRRTRG